MGTKALSVPKGEFPDTFTDQQKEMLEKYGDTINETHSLSEQAAFQYGFWLGVRLMMESVSIQTTTED